MTHVLFVCLHNAGRSQMSQALFEQASEGRHTAASAGTAPAAQIHPEVVQVMREIGIELSDRRPRLLTQELTEQAHVVVTMGCGDECPLIPGKRYIDWELPDPKGQSLTEVRATRDAIARRVRELLQALDSDNARDLAERSNQDQRGAQRKHGDAKAIHDEIRSRSGRGRDCR